LYLNVVTGKSIITAVKKTLLSIFAHSDDELAAIGTIANHAKRGDRIIMACMTPGTRTSFLDGTDEEKRAARTKQAEEVAKLVGAEARCLDFEDTAIYPSREASLKVAELIREIKPTIIITWNQLWATGPGHPDHRYTSVIVLDAVSYARFKIPEISLPPYREIISLYLAPGLPTSPFPLCYVDISTQEKLIRQFTSIYEKMYGPWQALNLKLASSAVNGFSLGCELAESFNVIQRGSSEAKYLD